MINLLKYGKYVLSAADIGLLEYINKMFQDLKFGKSTQTAKVRIVKRFVHIKFVQKGLDYVGHGA
jgi:hypothetical protein